MTRKRSNNYTRIIIWLPPVKSLSRVVVWAFSRFVIIKKFKHYFRATFVLFTKNETNFLSDDVKSCQERVSNK